ncbi:MAG: hypothetical protein ACKVXR_16950 [Planctomycetota bacterium]
MRVLAAILVLAAVPLGASAQEDPVNRAIAENERLRAAQMRQLHRAEVRTQVNPYGGDFVGGDPKSARPATAIEIPREKGKGEGAAPWLIPSVLGAAALLVAIVSMKKRNRWSALPGHEGLSATRHEDRRIAEAKSRADPPRRLR